MQWGNFSHQISILLLISLSTELSKLTVEFLRYSASMVKIEFSNEHHVLSVWIHKKVIGITRFSLVGAKFCDYCRLATSLIFYLFLVLFYKKIYFWSILFMMFCSIYGVIYDVLLCLQFIYVLNIIVLLIFRYLIIF